MMIDNENEAENENLDIDTNILNIKCVSVQCWF